MLVQPYPTEDDRYAGILEKAPDGYTVVKEGTPAQGAWAILSVVTVIPRAPNNKDPWDFAFFDTNPYAKDGINLFTLLSDLPQKEPNTAAFIDREIFAQDGYAKTVVLARNLVSIQKMAQQPNYFWLAGARPALGSGTGSGGGGGGEEKKASMGAGTVLLIAGGVALAYYLIAGQKKASYGYSPNRRRRRH